MTDPCGLVLGTAGHIDHGKTSLVQALTGIDTDRLAEEKRRGISIDLGFAYLTLPDGCRISFIDVPGHERFIKNMLAGVGGIQAVLLIVAADEGVKPQTREHFEICRLLGVHRGMVALTKADLASSEQLTTTRLAVEELCAGSFLSGQPIIPVSSRTGEGLQELRHALSNLARQTSRRSSEGLPRLPIDRSFAIKGFGTVVTGTLWSGELRVGDSVYLYPEKREARIRGLQVHGKPVEAARAGERTAVNLTGVEHSEIQRGFVLTHRDELTSTSLFDASVQWLNEADMPTRREQLLLHVGTAEIPVSLKLISADRLKRQGMARLWMKEPGLLLPGDHFVLRRPSPACTVAGGTVIDPFPPARLNRKKAALRLQTLAEGSWAKRLSLLVSESPNGRRITDLVRRTGLSPEQLKSHVAKTDDLLFVESAGRVFSKLWIERQREKLLAVLQGFHTKHPNLPGAPIALARMNLEPAIAQIIFANFPTIRTEGETVSLATHKAQTSPEQTRFLAQIEQAFRQGGFQPPSPSDALRAAGTDVNKGRGFLEALIKSQKLVRISEDLVFHADVVAHIRRSLQGHKGRRFSVPEFKEWTQISRKYAIPLLEYLDRQHVTRREGDARVVL
ncbi:MAG: selenocysteine-specific translation elongation factor [Acidobacteriaceae bacterium]|nr:selenocysteine-specific translation elongation factor [Acidobacteriaceae bacterium]